MVTIYSDASLEGWGATDSTCMVGGRWDEDVALEHKFTGTLRCQIGFGGISVFPPGLSHSVENR